MSGNRPQSGCRGGFRGQMTSQPPPPPYPPPPTTQRSLQQGPLPPQSFNFNPHLSFQDPNVYLQNLTNAFLQNFNFASYPNFPIQNPNLPPPPSQLQQQQRPQQFFGKLPPQPPPPPPPPQQPGSQSSQLSGNLPLPRHQRSKPQIQEINRAVENVRDNLLAAGEHVSAWKVWQAAIGALQDNKWDSSGIKMLEVPSMNRLMVTEGRINSFIHCFVGVRNITSLYEVETAICKNEGVEQFDELGLGPLLCHPLVLCYFPANCDVTEVFKITADEILLFLSEFMDAYEEKHVNADELLEYVARKKSVAHKEMLGIRIQSLQMHISFIREAKGNEFVALKKFQQKLRRKYDEDDLKHLPVSKQKKHLDKRFHSISNRIDSFSLLHKDFCGKHIRFASSGSEDEESDDSMPENVNGSDHVSSCPYPSVTEEIARLRSKFSSASGSSKHKENEESFNKKRKFGYAGSTVSVPSKLLRRDSGKHDAYPIENTDTEEVSSMNEVDLRAFVTTWKDTCKEHTANEVLERMLDFYKPRGGCGKIIRSIFSSYPFIALLNLAVTSIRHGIWDSVYDVLQSVTQDELTNTLSVKDSEHAVIDVESNEEHTLACSERNMQHSQCFTVQEIIKKISEFFELYHDFDSNGKSLLENNCICFGKLCSCESWLVDQFGVMDFKSLGHGEFFTFLEKHTSILPPELCKLLGDDTCEGSPLEVCMLQHQLIVLVSQALNGSWENESITKQMILSMVKRQFPLLGFKIIENSSLEEFQQLVQKYRNNVVSNCVLFSATLSGMHDVGNLSYMVDSTLETTEVTTHDEQKKMAFGSVTSNDAIKVMLRAPMLSDLNSLSHWDLLFAPSLGPLVGWLLSEVNVKELLCLMTKDGKVIRIDQNATADSFMEAALQGSSFQTAVQLLSFLSLSGGEKHVPLSLLKSYACRAFEVILRNHSENVETQDIGNHHGGGKGATNYSIGESQRKLTKMNQAVPVASRFVVDCLFYLPPEFRGFAAKLLLSGLQSVVKDAPSAILFESSENERIMLHDIGLSAGIMEWIDDYRTFSSTTSELSITSAPSRNNTYSSEISTGSEYEPNVQVVYSYSGQKTAVSVREDVFSERCAKVSQRVCGSVVSRDRIGNGCLEPLSALEKDMDAAMVIESIRRDEFGLVSGLSNTENSLLTKQHARLGRALHCLSQELYSEDSHFLLELVQNADDNIYPEVVEPTLTFILQESGVIVLNNEQGFSAGNIRALCDVGSSTKSRTSAGYIGHKGIGFKSVFRVTDAPEIHSNGFHIKFDIGEGEIGFVLPTVVPPCNINFFSRLVSDQMDSRSWNTCILLPFRPKLAKETVMKMFSDLRPSLLLFLRRLRCIMFRNMLNGSLVVMRKETLENGIIRVSCGGDKITWLIVSEKVQPPKGLDKAQATEIAVAFTLEESDNGDYSPCLEQQPVFAFLPLRTYGLKFILQGDFILPSSREEVDRNNSWNEWLLSKFPGLFVNAERSFCSISCFRENPGKAVAAFMSFVPLVGEVHGFFSGLPMRIISELRRTSCLLWEGDSSKMVPPCNVLRGWNEQARRLLPDVLLQEHLGLGFLDKNIVLSDSLARALGIAEYGPEILIKFMEHLCHKENGLKLMGLVWLSSWLNALYLMVSNFSGQTDLLKRLRKIPFIPLSNRTYSSVDVGTIWLHSDGLRSGSSGMERFEVFPKLDAKLRTVNPALISVSTVDGTLVDNIVKMLYRIGVQQLSAHEIVKVHILPAISDNRITNRDKDMMIDYLCFVMIHLQSSCSSCHIERDYIMSELRTKAYVLTNLGYRTPAETSIHFSREFGNPIDISKLIDVVDMKWHEVDITYVKHPANKSLSNGLAKWREFFKEIGVEDFVQVVQIDKKIADLSHTVFEDIRWDLDLISPGSVVKDWESNELAHLLSAISRTGNADHCMYLLEVLDMLWDDSFSDKATGYCSLKSGDHRPFKSSFVRCICNIPWVVSSMDKMLHCPKDLFYDCDAIRFMLGASAPYAMPKVRSRKLLTDIGFKTEVTLDDALELIRLWQKSGTPFMASLLQMSKIYTFIWEEMCNSKNKIQEAFHSSQFIFVPCELGSEHEALVSGVFLSSEDLYWYDPTDCVWHVKGSNAQFKLNEVLKQPLSKTLSDVYPGLHDFFVNGCGLRETPTCLNYLDILQQLSNVALPSQVASSVFKVFLKWSDGLRSGLLGGEDIAHLKECLKKSEYTVLPTLSDKWVSLQPSSGVVCWCDDKKLGKSFMHLNNIHFLHFGNLSHDDQEMLCTKVSLLMQNLDIPALSEVVTREAIYYGQADCTSKSFLIEWALPYAQRYIYSIHHDRYIQFQQSGIDNLRQLRIVVVEKLFYKNAIKSCGITLEQQYECSYLLQGKTLYTTVESDSHALYLELSRLFFGGSPDLHLANFLHMIMTMAESGSTEEEIEFFIVNSQKVQTLPDEEFVWSISSSHYLKKNSGSLQIAFSPTATDDEKALNCGRKSVVGSNGAKTRHAVLLRRSSGKVTGDNRTNSVVETGNPVGIEDYANGTLKDGMATLTAHGFRKTLNLIGHGRGQASRIDVPSDPIQLKLVSDDPGLSSLRFPPRDQLLRTGTLDQAQAMLTGREGERCAFRFLTEKFGEVVKWVNEDVETGLPYDIVIGNEERCREYIEVKATSYATKDWFHITKREWQFAVEKGESFSIAHVLLGNHKAMVTLYKNPAKLCQLGKLQLVAFIQSYQKEDGIVDI